MASQAAMLLDPKGYKKRLQSNGNIFPGLPFLLLGQYSSFSIVTL
jgi:hypothetical protein